MGLAAAAEVATRPPPRTRDIPLSEPNLTPLCEAARARLDAQRPLLPAPLRAVDAIEAAGKPFDEGLAIERRAFLELMETPESKGLRHAFFAERAAGKVDGLTPSTPARPLDQAAVIGAGTMGGITVALLDAGIPLWLVEADQAALDRGLARIGRQLRRAGADPPRHAPQSPLRAYRAVRVYAALADEWIASSQLRWSGPSRACSWRWVACPCWLRRM